MSNEFENQIEDELFKDKLNGLYKKYKIIIIILIFILILTPVLFQFRIYYENKKNSEYTALFLKSEMLIQTDSKEAIEILKFLKSNANETIKLLSISTLVDYYVNEGNRVQAIKILSEANINYKERIFNDLAKIQEALLKFDNINETEILSLLRNNSGDLKILKNKILYDYYIKNNQLKKAEEILK